MTEIQGCNGKLLRWVEENGAVAPFEGEEFHIFRPTPLDAGTWRITSDAAMVQGECSNVHVSSHRIIFQSRIGDASSHSWVGLRLDSVTHVEAKQPMFREARVDVTISSGRGGYAGAPSTLTIKMPAPRTAPLADAIRMCMQHRAWTRPVGFSKPAANSSSKASAPAATEDAFQVKQALPGVGRAMQLREQKLQERRNQVDDALGDLDSLRDKAAIMVSMAKRLSTLSGGTQEEQGEVSKLLQEYGLQGMVATANQSSNTFHEDLARDLDQACDLILSGESERFCPGMILLQDLYCVYNRARGTDLISPGDLMSAVNLLASRSTKIRTRKFGSPPVTAVELAKFSDKSRAEDLKKLVDEVGPVTASRLATIAKVSVTLARLQLLKAEELGALCRDDSMEGLAFHKNYFLDGAPEPTPYGSVEEPTPFASAEESEQ